jgi:hypothetical protein
VERSVALAAEAMGTPALLMKWGRRKSAMRGRRTLDVRQRQSSGPGERVERKGIRGEEGTKTEERGDV